MTPTEQVNGVRKHRVMLVEDHPVVLHGLANLINDEPDLAVCGGAENSAEALERILQFQPDIVVVDIALGNENGLALIKQIADLHPNLPSLALSMHDESMYGERALRAGAKGYVMKNEAMDRVMTAIRHVLKGDVYVSPKLAARVVQKFVQPSGASAVSPMEKLSDREFEVFTLISKGIGPTEIAQRFSVSVKTIETHRERIKEKLGLKSAAELIRFAVEWSMKQQ